MDNKVLNKKFFIYLTIVLLIFLIDRITKIYIIYLNNKFLNSEIFSSKFLNINLVWNEGIAFGLLSFNKTFSYNLLSLLILSIIIIIFVMILKSDGIKKFALVMIFGGAIGNLFDRIYFKAVPDFIDFHIGEFHWFIFNFADVFITIGVIFMILIELIGINKNNDRQI